MFGWPDRSASLPGAAPGPVSCNGYRCSPAGLPVLPSLVSGCPARQSVAIGSPSRACRRLAPPDAGCQGRIMHLVRGRAQPCVSDGSPGAGTSAKLSNAGSDNCATVSPELSRRRSFRADVGPRACKDLTTITRSTGRRDFRGSRTGLKKTFPLRCLLTRWRIGNRNASMFSFSREGALYELRPIFGPLFCSDPCKRSGGAIVISFSVYESSKDKWTWAAWDEKYQKVADGFVWLPTREAVVDYLNALKTDVYHATIQPAEQPMDAKTRERWVRRQRGY
jgi:hypothetical protein